MVLNKLHECCLFAIAALDDFYGWISEILAIVIFVFISNFLINWVLKKLQKRFEKQKKILKESFVSALRIPLSYFVWFFASIQALDLIASRILHAFPIENRYMIIAVGAVLSITWFLMRWKRLIVQYFILKSKKREIVLDLGKIDAMDKLASMVIIFFVILVLLEVTDRNMSTLIAFGGISGLALAFASQEVIANFFGGFMIYLTQPFSIGDTIQLPDHSIEGIVEEIGWYMTRVSSPDKRPIYIPNAIFSKLIVITPSRMSHQQIKETLKIDLMDLKKVKNIVAALKEMLQQHPDLDRSQLMIANFIGFNPTALEILIQAYTETTDNQGFLKIKEGVLLQAASVIEKHGAKLAQPFQYISVLHGSNQNLGQAHETQ